MENPVARPKPKPTAPVVATALSPTCPVKIAEEIAADLSRADLAKFRYLGYLSEKETTLFLSKDGELFIVKICDKIGTTYKIKEVNKDFIVILDTAILVEGRVSLSGEGTQQQQWSPLSRPAPLSLEQPVLPERPSKQQPASERIQKRRQRGTSAPPPE